MSARLNSRFNFAGYLLVSLWIGVSCSDAMTGKSDSSGDTSDGSGTENASDADVDTDADADSDNDTDSERHEDTGRVADPDCESDVIDCTWRCGRIRDRCDEAVLHNCGGCALGLVCDIVTNNCVDPLISCMDLDAECGIIRNSCGVRLSCGYCATGEECATHNNQCVNCTEPTCADLGYECGAAWNGCGTPWDPMHQLDCGSCGDGMICNENYNICDPDCNPDHVTDICFRALVDQEVECGYISDGCGGIVDCGDDCPDGKACGVRGVPNRCDYPERPSECDVAGWECGWKDSACEGIIHCGECPDGQVCRANHTCGDPCIPLTCETGYAGHCGQQLDDGCDGFITCGCTSGLGCNSISPGETGECEPLNTCVDYTDGQNGEPCSNGPAALFPRGDGVHLTCPCTGGRICVDDNGNLVTGGTTGTCCTNTGLCDGIHCTAVNSCTGQTLFCCNSTTQFCRTSDNTCLDRLTCGQIEWNGSFANGADGSPCSNGPAFNDGSGTLITCGCTGGRVCVDGTGNLVSGSTVGTCCTNQNTCQNTEMDTNCQIPNSCTGATTNCCSSNQCCEPGTPSQCVPVLICSDYTTGQTGQPCSNNSIFPRCSPESGDTRTRTCSCGSGLCCSQPNSAEFGVCLVNPTCSGTSACTVTNPCNGNVANCCTSSEYCDSNTNTCVSRETCATYTPRNLGSPCSDVPNATFPVGDGTDLTCTCNTSGGWSNLICEGFTPAEPGVCQCTPTFCNCSNSGSYDGCGTIINCSCPPESPVCDTSGATPTCCTPYACPIGTGIECGVSHPSCGSTISCNCTEPYETCGGGGTPNVCGCTPNNPCAGATGFQPDGCGNLVYCGG